MKVRVVWLGRPAASPYELEVETYRKRVQRRWAAEDRPLRPVAGGRTKDPDRIVRLEADLMLRHLEPGWHVTALDEAGSVCDSEAFAHRLRGHEERGLTGLIFLIGSDLGLSSGLLDRADDRLSLSPMTLPHQIARLLLWEQLFRATNILNGGAYHRVSVQ